MSLKLAFCLLINLYFYSVFAASEKPQLDDNQLGSIMITDRLIKMDEMKISDIDGFNQQLSDLKKIYPELNSMQQEFLSYLETYLWVIDGDLNLAQQRLKLLFEKVDNLAIKIRIKATLANIQIVSREYDNALNNLDYVIKNVELIPDEFLKSKVNLVAAVVYNSLEIYDMSAHYANLVFMTNVNDVYRCKASAIKLRSAIKMSTGYTEKDMRETIDLCKTHGQNEYAYILILDWLHAQLNKAYRNNNMDKLAEILQMIQEKDGEIEQTLSKNLIGLKNMMLAKAYAYNNNHDLATEYADLTLDGSHKSGNTVQLVEALVIKKDQAIRQQDYQTALNLLSQINEAERDIFTETKAKQMAHMTVMHSNLAKQLEINGLQQNNEVLSLENKLAEASAIKQRLIMLLVLSLLVSLAIWTYRIKRRHDYFKDVAEIDHLTQVFTRKAFEERLNDMLIACSSKNELVHVAMMDLDRFKLVNDLHGHLVGDWVLKHVILTCESVIDHDMMIARLGGEEFCMVSPGITTLQMSVLTEKMRQAIKQMDCSQSGADFNITASFGISDTQLSGYDYAELMTHADLALFAAKNKGRNQVIHYASIINTLAVK